jgi:hypothetical protein
VLPSSLLLQVTKRWLLLFTDKRSHSPSDNAWVITVIFPGNLKIVHSLYIVLGFCIVLSTNHGYLPVQYELIRFSNGRSVFTARYEKCVDIIQVDVGLQTVNNKR